MSSLRRRFLGESSAESSRNVTPENDEEVRLVPLSKLRNLTLKTYKKSKRRNGLIFGLGGLFGLLVAAFFANQQDVVNLNSLIDMNFYESLLDIIPSGIVKEAKDLQVSMDCHNFSVKMHEADSSIRLSNVNAMPRITTHSPSDFISSPKVLRHCIQLSWYLGLFLLA